MIVNDSVYGGFEIKDPLVLELIESKPMQRLNHINQFGSWKFIMPNLKTTRFEHSVGVYRLLCLLGAPREEQVAGLLHDVPHGAFSHVIDYVFDRARDQEYHEEQHKRIIMDSEIPGIVERGGLSVRRLIDEKNFPLLERDIPDFCADRLDYFMRDGLEIGLLKRDDIRMFMENLLVRDREIVCKSRGAARRMASLFLECSRRFWSSPLQSASYQILADAIRIAMDRGVIDKDDLFLTDDELLSKVRDAGIREIDGKLRLLNPSLKVVEDRGNHDFHSHAKARFIDPKVLEDGELVRVSDFDEGFRKERDDFVRKLKGGYYIRIVKRA
jgi:HD superfamily phosphohydrolase